jgi:hypothetical protein
MTELLIIQGMALLSAPALTGIKGIDRFLAERLVQILQRGRFAAAQEDLGIAVADDGICIVFINGLRGKNKRV